MAPASALLCLKTPFFSAPPRRHQSTTARQDKLLELGIRPLCSAPMAAVDGVVPPAPLARSRFALAAVDAFLYLLLASAWVSIAGGGASLIGHLACGIKCPAVIHAASTVMLVGGSSFVILAAVGALLFSKFAQPESEKTAATKGIMDSTVMAVHIISSAAFTFVEILGFLLKLVAVRGSLMDRVASVIVYVPPLGIMAMSCFVVLPGFAVEVWKMSPFSSASRSAESTFSYDMEQQVAN